MERREFISISTTVTVNTLTGNPSVLRADDSKYSNEKSNHRRALNPNTRWLREAKWGFFTHYLPHMPSDKVPEHMTGKLWNKKVNSFQVAEFSNQLSEIKAPYFFYYHWTGRGVLLLTKQQL